MLKALQRMACELDPEHAGASDMEKMVEDLGILERFDCSVWASVSDSVWPLQSVEREAELGSEPSTLTLPTEALHYPLLYVDIPSARVFGKKRGTTLLKLCLYMLGPRYAVHVPMQKKLGLACLVGTGFRRSCRLC